MNPKLLRSLKLQFYITINPTPRDSNALETAQFEKTMITGLQLLPDRINKDYFAEQWAIKNQLDPERAFLPQQNLQNPMGQGMLSTGQDVNRQLQQSVQGRQPRTLQPSLNRLANA